jgi:hypothetical protein
MNTYLKTFCNGIFMLTGACHFALFGLFGIMGYSFGWNEDIVNVMIIFFASTVLLFRAPTSRKKFEWFPIRIIRVIVVAFLIWIATNVKMLDVSELGSKIILYSSGLAAFLLTFAMQFRKNNLFRDLPPPRSQ